MKNRKVEGTMSNLQLHRKKDKEPKQNFNSLMVIGERYHSVPERLYIDDKLTNRAKMLWQMLKLDTSPYKPNFFPSYDELALWLSDQAFLNKPVSRKIVTQTLMLLRLTRWITLCETERDDNGRVVGNVYVINNEPLTVLDAEAVSDNYISFVQKCRKHKDNIVKTVADKIMEELVNDKQMHYLLSRLNLEQERMEHRKNSRIQLHKNNNEQTVTTKEIEQATNNVAEKIQRAPDTFNSSLRELGEEMLSSLMELSKNTEFPNGTKQNKNAKSLILDLVPSGNSYSTVSTDIYSNSTVNTDTVNKYDLSLFKLNEDDKQKIIQNLNKLDHNLADKLIQTARNKVMRGEVRNPSGYLYTLVKRALAGEFKLYSDTNKTNTTQAQDNQEPGLSYMERFKRSQEKYNTGEATEEAYVPTPEENEQVARMMAQTRRAMLGL